MNGNNKHGSMDGPTQRNGETPSPGYDLDITQICYEVTLKYNWSVYILLIVVADFYIVLLVYTSPR